MDTATVIAQAEEMAAKAKDGTLRLPDGVYTLAFDRRHWLYRVTAPNGHWLMDLNTKSLRTARKWLREWHQN